MSEKLSFQIKKNDRKLAQNCGFEIIGPNIGFKIIGPNIGPNIEPKIGPKNFSDSPMNFIRRVASFKLRST